MPELTELSTKIIHQLRTVTPRALKSAGITLGKDDPALIIDHKTGRERALKAYITIRNS
jgi:deoxyribodipyrimidine photo-lyase